MLLVLGGAAITLYACVCGLLWWSFFRGTPLDERVKWLVICTGVALHGILVYFSTFTPEGVDYSLRSLWTLVTFVMIIIVLLLNVSLKHEVLLVLVFLGSALVLALTGLGSGKESGKIAEQASIFTHLCLSVFAFAVLGLAAIQTTIFTSLQVWLHSKQQWRMVKSLPPLDTVEKLNFRLLSTGLLFLTLTVATGLVLYWEKLHVTDYQLHTTVAIAAWLLYGAIIAGHLLVGWRGRTTNVLSILAFVILTSSYFGLRITSF